MEIFSAYGNIKMVDFAMDKLHPNQGRGFAYVEFETADEAENAMKHMDGGKFDSCIQDSLDPYNILKLSF